MNFRIESRHSVPLFPERHPGPPPLRGGEGGEIARLQ